MKTALKILKVVGVVLLVALLLLLAGGIAIQSPRVQASIGRKVVEAFRSRTQADISYSDLAIQIPEAIILKDVIVKDKAPRVEGADTIATIGLLSTKFSLKELLGGGGINISHARLKDAAFTLAFEEDSTSETGSRMNFMRALGLNPAEDDDSGWGDVLSAGDLDIENFRFTMLSPPGEAERLAEGWGDYPGVINFNRLHAVIDRLKARHIRVKDSYISGTVDSLRIHETDTGFTLEQASGKVKVGRQRVRIDDFHLKDTDSDLFMDRFQLDGAIEDYEDFTEKIRISADIRKGSVLSMASAAHFGPGIDRMSFKANVEGKVRGYVNDFSLENLAFEELGSGVSANLKGSIMDVEEIEKSLFNLDVKNLGFTLKGVEKLVEGLAPDTRLDLSGIAKGQRMNFSGKLKGPLDRLAVKGKATSKMGSLDADVTLRNTVDARRPFMIGGKIDTKDFDLGEFLGIEELGPLTMESLVDATLADEGITLDTLSLNVSRLNALNYDYSDIKVAGKYTEQAFDGRIVSGDPNLDFWFQGIFNLSPRTRNATYRFYANLAYADLHALHLDARPKSRLTLLAHSDFVRTDKGELLGYVQVNDFTLESPSGFHDIGTVSINSHSNDNVNRIQLRSDFMEGSFVGDESILSFANDIKSLVIDRNLPALADSKSEPWSGASYDISLIIHKAQDILDFFAPGVYVADGTSLNLKIGRDGQLKGGASSSRLMYNGRYLKGLNVTLDNASESIQARIKSSALFLSGAELKDNNLTLFAKDNHLGIGYSFANDDDTKAQVYLSGDIQRERDGLKMVARALPSNIYYGGEGWGLSSGDIVIKGGDFKINNLQARHDDESILVHGGFSAEKKDTLKLSLRKFDMSMLDSVTGSSPSLAGRASGQAMVISPASPTPGLIASITCDSTYVSGRKAGTLNLESHWDDAAQGFEFSLANRLQAISNIDVKGLYSPAKHELGVTAKLLQLDLGYASFILDDVFSKTEGALSGVVTFGGQLDDMHLSSRGLHLDDGILELDFTRVPYQVSGNLSVDDFGLHFDDVTLADGTGGSGRVTGSVEWGGFKNLGMDAHVNFNEMHVVGVPRGVNSTLSGDVYASGRADIIGPMNALMLDVDARTTSGGNIRIPVNGSGSSRSMALLTFVEPPAEEELDPFEQMLLASSKAETQQSNLNVHLRVSANPETGVYIDLGDGMYMSGAGNGIIELELIPSQDVMNLGGNYVLTQGNFHLSIMGLVSKDFSIENGSSIRFNGDIWDSDLDVVGRYSTKATLAALISDDNATSRRDVDCLISISDKLSNPKLDFSIDVPDLNPGTEAMVKSALNTEDKVQKQFLALLVTGNFLPEEDTGITTGGTNTVFSNVAGIMAGQMNSIFQKLDIPLDLGLNYSSSNTGDDVFDVALSTQLFNNRVIVNGNIGNKQQYGVSTNEVAGDLDVEVKVNKTGSLRLNLFSHSADQFSSYLDNSQRNGAGIAYQRDFATISQFLHELFTPKETLRQEAVDALLNPEGTVTLQVDTTGRTTIVPKDE